jgi:Flp pilus assembly protein TadD
MLLPSRDRSIKNFALAVAFTLIFGPVSHGAALAQTGAVANADAPTQANAEYAQGVSALQRGDLAAARAAFEKVLHLVPNNPEAHNSLGWVLLAQGQTDDAIFHFRAALRAKPAFAQAHIN